MDQKELGKMLAEIALEEESGFLKEVLLGAAGTLMTQGVCEDEKVSSAEDRICRNCRHWDVFGRECNEGMCVITPGRGCYRWETRIKDEDS